MSETLTKIKRLIGHLTDIKEAEQAANAARDRVGKLSRREYLQQSAEAWERIKNLAPGTLLYCCASGTFLGGDIQRGDAMRVHVIQPRAKRLWVVLGTEPGGKSYWFNPTGINRYNLRTEQPTNPISPNERRIAGAVGKVFTDAFKEKE